MLFSRYFFNIIFMLASVTFIPEKAYGIVVISLGGDCTTASVLREFNIRKNAYPFDWMFSSFASIYFAIEDDFKHFLDSQTLKIGDDRRTIVDFYGFSFVHDFPTIHHSAALDDIQTNEWAEVRGDWKDFIEPIRAKYQRRIERLKNVLGGTTPVFLVRYGMSKDEAVKLRDLLLTLYPQLNCVIVAVCGHKDSDDDWRLEGIKNFCAPYNNPTFWSCWRNIFQELNIDSSNTKNLFESDCEDTFFCDGFCENNKAYGDWKA